jgi:hypothetical protein
MKNKKLPTVTFEVPPVSVKRLEQSEWQFHFTDREELTIYVVHHDRLSVLQPSVDRGTVTIMLGTPAQRAVK